MESKKDQLSQKVKNTSKILAAAKSNSSNSSSSNAFSGPVTRSKAKAIALMDQDAPPNPTLAETHMVVTNETLGKKEQEDVELRPPQSLSSMQLLSISDAKSSSGSHSNSSPGSPNGSTSSKGSISDGSSYTVTMPVMMTNVATFEEQLATMTRAIDKLTKTVEEKDMQIASLMNKLEAQNVGESNQAPSHPPGFTPPLAPGKHRNTCLPEKTWSRKLSETPLLVRYLYNSFMK